MTFFHALPPVTTDGAEALIGDRSWSDVFTSAVEHLKNNDDEFLCHAIWSALSSFVTDYHSQRGRMAAFVHNLLKGCDTLGCYLATSGTGVYSRLSDGDMRVLRIQWALALAEEFRKAGN